MTMIGLRCSRHEVGGGNALLTSERSGTTNDRVLFYNHYDVVEEGRKELWKTGDPFRAEVVDGKIYARGISDNKGGLFSRLHAVQAILAVRGTLPATVKFLIEGDEETSSPSMFRFAEENPEEFRSLTEADVCVWENGRKDEGGHPWARFGVRGSCAFDLRVTTAKSDTHSRMGATIPSASWRLVWALASLKGVDEKIRVDGFYDRVIPPTESDFEILRQFPYEEGVQKEKLGIKSYLLNATGEELKKRVYLEPSLSICGLESGEVHNGVRGIVPCKAYARISFYLVADQDPSELGSLLRRHLDKHGFPDIEVAQAGGANRPVRTPVDIPFRERVCEAAAKVYKEPMVIELTQLGGGPAIAIRNAWPEIPVVGFGPGNTGSNHHAPDENLKLLDYVEAVKHVAALLCSYDV
ncbi:MAG TPA: M20/M25/M40 family metallo-hydrolase [Rectinemataceae bacterium]|nr:M20/M25/M40 family metallo-hydrolase [Rectinemataceae bacterium]